MEAINRNVQKKVIRVLLGSAGLILACALLIFLIPAYKSLILMVFGVHIIMRFCLFIRNYYRFCILNNTTTKDHNLKRRCASAFSVLSQEAIQIAAYLIAYFAFLYIR